MSRPSSRQQPQSQGHSTRQTAPTTSTTNGGRSSRIGRASSIAASDSAHQEHQIDALTPAQQRLKDKQQEQAGFINILRQTQQLDTYLNDMAEKMALLQDGGVAMAKVLENWQNVFRATHIALAAMAARQARGEQDADAQLPTLVRIPTAATASSTSTVPDGPSNK